MLRVCSQMMLDGSSVDELTSRRLARQIVSAILERVDATNRFKQVLGPALKQEPDFGDEESVKEAAVAHNSARARRVQQLLYDLMVRNNKLKKKDTVFARHFKIQSLVKLFL